MSGMAVIDLASTKVALPAPLLSGHDRDEVIGMLNTGANSGAELSIAGDLYSDIRRHRALDRRQSQARPPLASSRSASSE